MKKQIFLIIGIVFSVFLCSNVFASDLGIQNFRFSGSKMIFKTSTPCQTSLSYESGGKQVYVELNDNVYRQSHDIQLWNLKFFTKFDYTLTVNNNKGIEETKIGTFTVTPADPDLYTELLNKQEVKEVKEEPSNDKIPLDQMTKEQLLAYIADLMLGLNK